MVRYLFIVFIALFVTCTNSSDEMSNNLPGDFTVDLERYAGLWHEAARMPNRFEKGCDKVTAEYSVLSANKVRVVNSCTKADGSFTQSEGKAKLAKNSEDNRKLKVTFFWPFSGNYWIIDLDKDYQYAVVSDPSRDYGWILARELPVPDDKMKELVQVCKEWGLETERLIFPPLQ